MLRPSRRTWVTVAAVVLAISAAIACGETLPSTGDDPHDAGAETGASDGAEAEAAPEGGTDAGAQEGGDAADDVQVDGPVEAGAPCTVDLPFDPPVLLANFDALGAVSSVRPHHGGEPFAFVSRDNGAGSSFFDIVETDYPLGPGTNPAAMRSGPNNEDHPAPLVGNMKVYYDEPIEAGVLRIFSATRAQAGQNLSNPNVEDIPLGAGTSVMHPYSVAGQDILYVALRSGPTTVDIWRMAKSGASWAPDPQLVGAFEKTHPVVSDDETVMYFARNDSGKRRVLYTTRGASSGTWSNALELEGLDSQVDADDEPSWLSPDKCTLIFISNRNGASRAYKLVRKHF